MIFVVGRSSWNELEANAHGDLLEIDIEETYRNMVYKVRTIFFCLKVYRISDTNGLSMGEGEYEI